MLIKQGQGKIDWTDRTWNPISGKCKHNCDYCYMHAFWRRNPASVINQIKENYLLDKMKFDPCKIFVGSSTDMWGEWVSSLWIMKVINKAALHPKHIFQFLTKNPSRYMGWAFSENMWFGTTVDGTEMTQNNLFSLIRCVSKEFIRFVSFEPMIKRPFLNISHFKNLDWIIIGANSSRGAEKPPKEWADYLISTARNFDIAVWVKDNYGYPEVIKEFPKC